MNTSKLKVRNGVDKRMIDKKAREAIKALVAMCVKNDSITFNDSRFVLDKINK